MDIASSLANAGNGQHDRGVSCHPSEATARVAAVILYPSLGCPLVLAPGQTRARLVIGVNASDSRRFAVDATTGLAQAAHPYIDRHLRLCPIERKPDDTDTTQGTLFGDGRTYAKARAALTTRALGPFRAQSVVHCSDGTAFSLSPAGMRLYHEFEGGTLYEIEFDPRAAPFARIDASGFQSFAWMVALTPAEKKAWPDGNAPCAAHYQDLLVQRFLQAQRGTRGGAIGDLREYDVDAIGATRIGAPGADRPRLQAWHPVIRASTPTLRIAHLSDVHVNLRQQALARSRAILLEGAEGAGPLAEPFAARTLCNAFLHLRGLFEAVAPSREPDSALLLTGDLIDFNRNIDPARAGATLGEQWRAFNILGNAHDADLYARWQDDMQVYSLVRHAYARLRLPVFMTTGNHEAYEMPYGISPRVGGWGMALGAMENAGRHAGPSVVERTDPALARHRGRLEEASRFSPTRANEGIAADHNLTIYEAALAYGPTYGQTYTSLNYDAANFDLFGALFNPLGDFVVGLGGPQGARTAGQLLVGLAWGEHENFQNLAGGTGSVGVDRQGAMILPRAASSFSPGQQALLRHAQQLKAASGASLLVASHFTIFSYDQGVPFSAADAGFTPADTPDGQLHSPGGLTAFNMGTCERRLRWYFDHLVLGDGPRVDWHFSGHSHRAGVYQAAVQGTRRGHERPRPWAGGTAGGRWPRHPLRRVELRRPHRLPEPRRRTRGLDLAPARGQRARPGTPSALAGAKRDGDGAASAGGGAGLSAPHASEGSAAAVRLGTAHGAADIAAVAGGRGGLERADGGAGLHRGGQGVGVRDGSGPIQQFAKTTPRLASAGSIASDGRHRDAPPLLRNRHAVAGSRDGSYQAPRPAPWAIDACQQEHRQAHHASCAAGVPRDRTPETPYREAHARLGCRHECRRPVAVSDGHRHGAARHFHGRLHAPSLWRARRDSRLELASLCLGSVASAVGQSLPGSPKSHPDAALVPCNVASCSDR